MTPMRNIVIYTYKARLRELYELQKFIAKMEEGMELSMILEAHRLFAEEKQERERKEESHDQK